MNEMNFENLITAVKYSWRDERIQKMYKELLLSAKTF